MSDVSEDKKTSTGSEGASLFGLIYYILKPEKNFYALAIIYGVAISLLTLAVPISVQMLIGNVANTALLQPVVVLSLILFILLGISGTLNALQVYVMELFERRFFTRITSEIVQRNIFARYAYYERINRAELVNRYFEIMLVQKNVPILLIPGFALVLQTIVGLVVVSFYHPYLFAFNCIFVICVLLVWYIWARRAIRSSIDLSTAKYDMARWLEDLARNNTFFKTAPAMEYALEKSDKLAGGYINQRKRYFRATFAQTIGFLFIYAFASSALLGLGGWLVIQGQLTLGQLVAAELILSAIFFGISRASDFLIIFYELCAASDKLSRFLFIPLEELQGERQVGDSVKAMSFQKVRVQHRDRYFKLNFDIPAGAKILADSTSYTLQKLFIDLVKRHREPKQGHILYGGYELRDYDMLSIRSSVIALDTNLLIEATIEEYLRISDPNASRASISEMLQIVGLDETITALPQGMNTMLSPSGYPLANSEALRLKLAAALLRKPKILIINELYDTIAFAERQRILQSISTMEDLTLIYFSNRKDIAVFDSYLHLDTEEQRYFQTLADFPDHDSHDT
jgi:putative ABC transport system ATP-binding protein